MQEVLSYGLNMLMLEIQTSKGLIQMDIHKMMTNPSTLHCISKTPQSDTWALMCSGQYSLHAITDGMGLWVGLCMG